MSYFLKKLMCNCQSEMKFKQVDLGFDLSRVGQVTKTPRSIRFGHDCM